MSNVQIDRLSTVISQTLNTYSRDVADGVAQAAEITVNEMVQRTKQRPTTKLSRGKYARSIASREGERTLMRRSQIWHVKKPRYRLAHLLNHGHRLRGGGHVSGDRHVTQAAEKSKIDFENRVVEVIRRAGN